MNTNKSKKFYNAKELEERRVAREKERKQHSVYVRRIKLAYSESSHLLSLYEYYTEVLAGDVLSPYDETDLLYIDRELDRIESRLCVLLRTFLSDSKELPNPWQMISNYKLIYGHFYTVNALFRDRLGNLFCPR